MRIGLIGAGAIAQSAYLPALSELPNLKLTSIVETNDQIIENLSTKMSLEYIGKDINRCFDHVDVLIVAVPNYLHFPVCKACLTAGKHVLCEKPLAISTNECENLLSVSNFFNRKLAVAHVRRFYPAVRIIKEIISSGELGNFISFDFKEGTVFSWPTVTGFVFDKAKAGGGVLIDIGVHLLDLLLWWLPYEISDFTYADDNLGGVEACAEIELILSNGTKGNIKISRLSVLNNLYILYFEKGCVKWNPFSPRRIYVQEQYKKLRTITLQSINPVKEMLLDFKCAVKNDQQPIASAQEAGKVIKIIEDCYSSRAHLSMSWLHGSKAIPC